MKFVLGLLAAFCIFLGIGVFTTSTSATHEIEASIVLLIGIVLLCAVAILHAIGKVRGDMKALAARSVQLSSGEEIPKPDDQASRFMGLSKRDSLIVLTLSGVLLVFLVAVVALRQLSPLMQATKEAMSPTQAARPLALAGVKLDYTWSKNRSNTLFLNFSVTNKNSQPIQDYTISCTQYGGTGTQLGSVSKKVNRVVGARGKQDFTGFEMGSVDSQTERTLCEVIDPASRD